MNGVVRPLCLRASFEKPMIAARGKRVETGSDNYLDGSRSELQKPARSEGGLIPPDRQGKVDFI
jgi:hypothetical protein